MFKTAIILPAYNESEHIRLVINDIATTVQSTADFSYDTIVINDGSTDKTAEIAQSAGANVISHTRNRGLGTTFRTAITTALEKKYDCMVFFDADGQFSAKDIPNIIAPIASGSADFVLGTRFANGTPHNMPRMKLVGNTLLAQFISWTTRTSLTDVSCGFRAYGKEALFRINVSGRFTYTQEVILDLLFKRLYVTSVPISVKYFPNRTSAISSNLWKYGWRVFLIIARTFRDYRPLLFFGFVGGMLFCIGLLFDTWLIIYYLRTGVFSPYKIIGFGGAFLNFLGVTIWFIGLVADMLNQIRRDQEELLYLQKKNHHRI